MRRGGKKATTHSYGVLSFGSFRSKTILGKGLEMIDFEGIKAAIDCRVLVREDGARYASKSARYEMYKCPIHHESKGASLAVWADGWKCFGACNRGGSVIDWMEAFHGLTPAQAAQTLVLRYNLPGYLIGDYQGMQRPPVAPRVKVYREPEPYQPPPVEWQLQARELLELAQENLWSGHGARALDYLLGRGLNREIIRRAGLGYIPAMNPEDYVYGHVFKEDWKVDGKTVRVHCGIYIPHELGGNLWALRVRRLPGIEGAKYMGIRGGGRALYWADNIVPGDVLIVTEGEIDCLSIDQAAFDLVSVVALASASNHELPPNFLSYLALAPRVLLRMDADGAGEKAAQALMSKAPNISRIAVPDGYKDVNELLQQSGPLGVRRWVEGLLTPERSAE